MGGIVFDIYDFMKAPSQQGGVILLVNVFALASALLILLPFHECAHALVAKWLGDDTALYKGRITLNPLAHIDPVGTACILLAGFGWAKPVPINPLRATRKISMRAFIALTAAAGPISNLLYSLVCIIMARIVLIAAIPSEIVKWFTDSNLDLYSIFWYLSIGSDSVFSGVFSGFAQMYNPMWAYFGLALIITATISVSLAVFNLIPIPPLDGSKVMFYFLKTRHVQVIEKYMHYIRYVMLGLLFFRVLGKVIGPAANLVMTGLEFITSFIK
jgi:Zn-dependent protease